MKSDQLITILQSPIGKRKVVELAKIITDNDFSIEELIDLTLHENEQMGFRASWILENIYSNDNECFIPYSIYFLDRFSFQKNLSAMRHYAKVLAFMTSKKASPEFRQIIINYHTDLIVETVFNWVIDEKVPVAVKSQCLNVLGNLYIKHDWIKDELLQTMDFLIDKESIAFYAKVKMIRKQFSVNSYQLTVSPTTLMQE